jgi:hypothetical protein
MQRHERKKEREDVRERVDLPAAAFGCPLPGHDGSAQNSQPTLFDFPASGLSYRVCSVYVQNLNANRCSFKMSIRLSIQTARRLILTTYRDFRDFRHCPCPHVLM